jgi:hypothetical protein
VKKIVYSVNQIKELTGYLDTLVLTGRENFKRAALISQIIDNPLDAIEEKEGETNECNEPNTSTN